MVRSMASLCSGLVMAVLLVAGLAKAISPADFADSLVSWVFIPAWAIRPLAVAVPACEIGLALMWILNIHRRWAGLAAMVLLALFTLAYGAHVLWAQPPDCNCLGKILAFEQSRRDTAWVLGRNAVLLLLAVCGVIFGGPRSPSREGRDLSESEPPLALSREGGFTLIEVLVSIAVVAVILTLAVPVFRHARAAARNTKSLSNIAQHAKVFHVYAADWKDAWPNPVRPDGTWGGEKLGPVGRSMKEDSGFATMPYFLQSRAWSHLLADAYYNSSPAQDVFYPPGYGEIVAQYDPEAQWRGDFSPYYYSCTFYTDPAFWRPETRTGSDQYRATRTDEVSFPSRKGVLGYHNEVEYLRAQSVGLLSRVEMGFADGSSRALKGEELASGYPGGAHGMPGAEHGEGTTWHPAAFTLDGVRGVDIR